MKVRDLIQASSQMMCDLYYFVDRREPTKEIKHKSFTNRERVSFLNRNIYMIGHVREDRKIVIYLY